MINNLYKQDDLTKEKIILEQEIKEKNKQLIKKYPFLLPRNVWTGELDEEYDYSYTWFDDIPKGWRECFGLLLMNDINEVLQKSHVNCEDFMFTQIKEKYGSLRVYVNSALEEVYDVIDKYEYLSEHVCIVCGKVDVPLYGGWICPYCDKCAKEIYGDGYLMHRIDCDELKKYYTVNYYGNKKIIKKKVSIVDILNRFDKKFM